MRTLRSENSAVGAVMLAIFCLLAATGCAGDAGAKAVHPDAKAARRSPRRRRPLDPHCSRSSSAIASSCETAPVRPAATHSPVRRQRDFHVDFLQKLRRGMTLHRLELPQLPERNDRGRLAAQVDHLVGARVTRWVCGHGNTYRDPVTFTASGSRSSTVSCSIPVARRSPTSPLAAEDLQWQASQGDHARGWESEARNWTNFARIPGHDRAHENINMPALLDLLPPRGRRALDLACGEGRLGRRLTSLDYQIAGIDASLTMVRFATTHQSAAPAVLADSTALPFRDEGFDLVVAYVPARHRRHAPDGATGCPSTGAVGAIVRSNSSPDQYRRVVPEPCCGGTICDLRLLPGSCPTNDGDRPGRVSCALSSK
jgi:hypothetical protein